MAGNFFISEPCCWAPGLESDSQNWKDWADGKKEIEISNAAPSIQFTDSLFRRRLSQLSKMTVQVVHDILSTTNVDKNTQLVFVSLRGEIDREFKINKTLIEDQMILPAGFSLSVFNAPVALATIAMGLKGGYTAVYPGKQSLVDGILTAASAVASGAQDKIILIYADEMIPECYEGHYDCQNVPLAFAAVLSKNKPTEYWSTEYSISDIKNSPVEFLKDLYRRK